MGAGQNKLVCFSFIHLKIVKGERKGKWKSHFRLDYAEPYPIFYKDSEKRAEEKKRSSKDLVSDSDNELRIYSFDQKI